MTTQLRNPCTVGRCAHCGGEARLTAGGWRCSEGEPQPATPRRTPGHGTGLDGPACPERAGRPQTPDGLRLRMCIRCGRITARLDTDGVAWCGGDMPAVQREPVAPARAPVIDLTELPTAPVIDLTTRRRIA